MGLKEDEERIKQQAWFRALFESNVAKADAETQLILQGLKEDEKLPLEKRATAMKKQRQDYLKGLTS